MKPFTLQMYKMYKKVKTDYEFLSVLYDDIVYSEDQLDENFGI